MGYKRYVIIIAALLFAIFLDAFIYTSLLGVGYGEVPMAYHIGNIIMLWAALAIIGDSIFKGGVLR